MHGGEEKWSTGSHKQLTLEGDGRGFERIALPKQVHKLESLVGVAGAGGRGGECGGYMIDVPCAEFEFDGHQNQEREIPEDAHVYRWTGPSRGTRYTVHSNHPNSPTYPVPA